MIAAPNLDAILTNSGWSGQNNLYSSPCKPQPSVSPSHPYRFDFSWSRRHDLAKIKPNNMPNPHLSMKGFPRTSGVQQHKLLVCEEFVKIWPRDRHRTHDPMKIKVRRVWHDLLWVLIEHEGVSQAPDVDSGAAQHPCDHGSKLKPQEHVIPNQHGRTLPWQPGQSPHYLPIRQCW